MPKDTLEASSPVQVGSDLLVNAGGVPIFNASPNGFYAGDVILHQGVPYVAWCELVNSTLSASGDNEYYGPYVAQWNGSTWVRLSDPPLAVGFDPGDLSFWVPLDLAGGSPITVAKGGPKLASDGTYLYVGVPGAIARRMLDPPANLFNIYDYFETWLIHGFQYDAGTWVTIGDTVLGVFPEAINTLVAYTTEDQFFEWDISASADSVGNCYFALSQWGNNPHSGVNLGTPDYTFLSVAGTDLLETMLADDGQYIVTLDGGGSTLALYYQANVSFPVAYHGDIINVWTQTDTGDINVAALNPPTTGTIGPRLSADTSGGVRYLAFEVQLADGTEGNVVMKVDPAAPADVLDLDARINVTTGLSFDWALQSTHSLAPITLAVEPENYWLGLAEAPSFGGINHVEQLDRQCPTTAGWVDWALTGADFASGHMVLYGDALWWFAASAADTLGSVPQVWKTPICRGCADCPAGGLHIWQIV